ncbi:MAG: XRE family transcriptional regulator [Erysipelotrichia bacterium]|nr:XRE family transcriptional regulator [Erysipelotrichia bacterium]
MTIGEKIRQERTYKKLSQKQLAEKVGMSEPAIRNYELGNRKPSQKQIELIANALDVSLFTLSDPDLDTYYGIIHALFYLENKINLQPVEIEGQIYLKIPPTDDKSRDTYDRMRQWLDVYTKFQNNELSLEEYKEWKDTYPQQVIFNKK